MAIHRSTTYKEHLGDGGNASPDMSFSPGGGQVTRIIQVIPGTHGAVLQAAKDFLGYSETLEAGGIRYISRQTPHAYPPAPWYYCTSMPRSEGISFSGRTNDAAEYQISKHTLFYNSLSYDIREDYEVVGDDDLPHEGYVLANDGIDATRYITKMVKPSAKLLVLNRGMMQGVKADAANQTKALLEGVPHVEPCAQVEYTWHDVPADGVPNLLHKVALGRLNDATFDGYPPGTLRLDSIEPYPRRDALGRKVYDIVYKMQYLPRAEHTYAELQISESERPLPTPRGHNWFLTVVNQQLCVMRITTNGQTSGQPPYRSMSYPDLFRPDQPPSE
jgi:hypothetical protein